MEHREQERLVIIPHSIIERCLVFFPSLFLFYYCMYKSLQSAKWLSLFGLVTILFFIQITTHMYLFMTGCRCSPTYTNSLPFCNSGALLIGIIYLIITMLCLFRKITTYGFFTLLVSIYIILSHIITIHPLKGTLISDGMEMPIFDINSFIFLMSHHWHENKLKRRLHEMLQTKKGSIVDAGAYIGDTSLPLAKNNTELTVYAIEPSIRNCNYIKKLVTLNGIKNVVSLHLLLSNKKSYYTTERMDQPNASYHEIMERTTTTSTSSMDSIESDSLDNLVHFGIIKTPVSLLHYDVEGMELAVLQGSINTIHHYKPIIVIEMLQKNKHHNQIIYDYFQSIGYQSEIVDETCVFGDVFDWKKCRNVIFTYNEQHQVLR